MEKPDIPFEPWPKIPRLLREIVITEKIDGTNAGILITEEMEVYASSRTRWITPESDNYGFARWVDENGATLVQDLGAGMHFGEWWGAGVQRRYGLDHKRFSLFNVHKWGNPEIYNNFKTPNLHVIPVLYKGAFDALDHHYPPWIAALNDLEQGGSVAAPGFMNPEGIVVFHPKAGQAFKITLGDDGHKEVG
jgi:hypothetical protein